MFQSLYVISIAELIVNQIEQALKSIQSLKFDEATSLLTSIYDTISGKVSSLGSNEPDETSNECFILSEFINLLLDYTSFWALVVSEKYSDSWSKLQDVQSRLRVIYRFTEKEKCKKKHKNGAHALQYAADMVCGGQHSNILKDNYR